MYGPLFFGGQRHPSSPIMRSAARALRGLSLLKEVSDLPPNQDAISENFSAFIPLGSRDLPQGGAELIIPLRIARVPGLSKARCPS
jgi:hypothetical protein